MSRRRAQVSLAGATVLLGVTLWLAAALTSADARTRPSDVRATSTYLRAEVAVDQALVDNVHRGVVAGEELAALVGRECPGVAARAPTAGKSSLLGKLAREVGYAAIFAFITPDLPSYHGAANTLSRLRWSDHRLTALVHQLARENAAVIGQAPDLCGDWRSWVASDYKVLPAGTIRLLAQTHLPTGEHGPELLERIEGRLEGYEGPRQRSMARRLERLRGVLGERTAAGLLLVAEKLATELGLVRPGPPGRSGGPSALTIQPPSGVVRSGGRQE